MKTVPLGEIAQLGSGGTPKRSVPEYFGPGIPWMSIADMNDGVVYGAKESLTEIGLANSSAKVVPPGTILLAMYGSIGKLAVAGVPLCTSQAIAFIRPDPKKVDRDFLFHYLRAQRPQLQAEGRGGTQMNISQGDLKKWPIPLPPLDEQRRIAAILDKLDSLRSKRLNVITALDDLVRSLFCEASGAEPSTVMPLPDAYWFQEGPGIRKWQFTDSGVKLLNVGNITVDGRLDLSKTDRHVSSDEANGRYKHFLVDPGDLVIASSGISFDADGLLRTRGAFVDEVDLPLCMNTSTIRFKAKTGLSDLTYLRSWLNSAEFRSQISRLVTGSAQLNFGPSHLKQMQITLPPVSVQERFAQQVGAIERHRTMCLEMLTQSDQMTASVQSDAFTDSL